MPISIKDAYIKNVCIRNIYIGNICIRSIYISSIYIRSIYTRGINIVKHLEIYLKLFLILKMILFYIN